MGDHVLLHQYATRGDREALGEVVRRHIDFVYAAAMRQTRDPHAAEDVTQAVFIVLARRARAIHSDAALPGWLFSVTRFAAASARRLEQRRAFHERRAAREVAMRHCCDVRNDLLGQLDDAIADLSEADRRGVLLSFFQNKTFLEVGAALGISEEAARKRVARAVERMRTWFARRGEPVATASLTAVMAEQASIAAPPHLVAPAANVAIITQSVSPNVIARGVGKMILWSTLKPVAAAAAALVIVSSVVGQVVLTQSRDHAPAAELASSTKAGADAPIDLGDGVRIDLVAISSIDGGDWHTPGGAPVDAATMKPLLGQLAGTQIILPQEATHKAIVRVIAPPGSDIDLEVPGAAAQGHVYGEARREDEQIHMAHFALPAGASSADLKVIAATGAWETILTNDNVDSNFDCTHGCKLGGVIFTDMRQIEGKATLSVITELTYQPWRVVALDAADNVLGMHMGNETMSGKISTCKPEFPVDREQIRKLEVQTRPFNKTVTFRNCTLDTKKPNRPTIETKK